jgi:hypothetical protein
MGFKVVISEITLNRDVKTQSPSFQGNPRRKLVLLEISLEPKRNGEAFAESLRGDSLALLKRS